MTMTTLGFGYVVADPLSVWAHVLLTVQVLLGYVMLASLACGAGEAFGLNEMTLWAILFPDPQD